MVQDIIGEIALVHGEGNVPRQRTVYYWLEDINAGRFELSKGALLRCVEPRLSKFSVA